MRDNDINCELRCGRGCGRSLRVLNDALAGLCASARGAGVVILAALACFLLPGSLLATDWNLSATFQDEGTLTGTFTLINSTVSNWNIVASSGSNMPALTFTPSNSTASYSTDGSDFCAGPCLQFVSNQEFGSSSS